MKYLLMAVVAACAFESQAASVFKCVDAFGKVTFTQHNCPDASGLDDVVSAHNPRPSGSGQGTVMAVSPQAQSSGSYQQVSRPVQSSSSGVTVVGGSREKIPCDTGLSDRDLRTAKVRGEVVEGMSRKDVESMYGKPNSDGHAQGRGGSTYVRDRYVEVTHVNYGRGGCVSSSYQSGDGRGRR